MDTETTVIPFEVTRVPDNTKPVGHEEVVQDGVDGVQTVIREDGQIVSNRITKPKNEVVYYGTKEEEVTPENVSTPELPQEEVVEPAPFFVQEYSDGFVPPEPYSPNQSQGRFSQLGGKLKEITNVNLTALKKAALEAARLLVFAIPGILITVLTDNPELGGSLGATILLVLKSLDRGIHEDKTTEAKGLLPF